MRWLALVALLTLAGATAARALTGNGGAPGARATAVGATGSFTISDSREGAPIFGATEIAPGDSASGTVEIADTGSDPARLTLSQHGVVDARGLGGGELSAALALRVRDVTVPAAPVTVYAGPLAPMPDQIAGTLAPGESRTFEFVATLPAAGPAAPADPNAFQAASTSVAYAWTASEVTESSPGPIPSPSAPPAAPAVPGPPAADAPPLAAALRLSVTRIHRAIRGRRLLVRAGCDSSCAIAIRGRLRARGEAGRRGAKLQLTRRPRLAVGSQRLRIRIPAGLRRWLRKAPGQVRLTARVSFVARDAAGNRATARRTFRALVHR